MPLPLASVETASAQKVGGEECPPAAPAVCVAARAGLQAEGRPRSAVRVQA